MLTRYQRRIVEKATPFARRIAGWRRFQNKGIDPDTLIAAAYEGLCDAARKYDSYLGSFSKFATKHIRGRLAECFDDVADHKELLAAYYPEACERQLGSRFPPIRRMPGHSLESSDDDDGRDDSGNPRTPATTMQVSRFYSSAMDRRIPLDFADMWGAVRECRDGGSITDREFLILDLRFGLNRSNGGKGRTIAEVSVAMALSVSTVKATLNRCLAVLKTEMERKSHQ